MTNLCTEVLHRSALDKLAACHVQHYGGESEHRQTMVELCKVMSIAGAESLNYVPIVPLLYVSKRVRELDISITIDGLIDGKATMNVLNLERH